MPAPRGQARGRWASSARPGAARSPPARHRGSGASRTAVRRRRRCRRRCGRRHRRAWMARRRSRREAAHAEGEGGARAPHCGACHARVGVGASAAGQEAGEERARDIGPRRSRRGPASGSSRAQPPRETLARARWSRPPARAGAGCAAARAARAPRRSGPRPGRARHRAPARRRAAFAGAKNASSPPAMLEPGHRQVDAVERARGRGRGPAGG